MVPKGIGSSVLLQVLVELKDLKCFAMRHQILILMNSKQIDSLSFTEMTTFCLWSKNSGICVFWRLGYSFLQSSWSNSSHLEFQGKGFTYELKCVKMTKLKYGKIKFELEASCTKWSEVQLDSRRILGIPLNSPLLQKNYWIIHYWPWDYSRGMHV